MKQFQPDIFVPTRSDVFARTLVIAPHPDDETLGAGGTIARLARTGHDVRVAVVTTGRLSDYPASEVAVVRSEAEQAHALLGVKETSWLDLPAARVAETPRRTLNAALQDVVSRTSPTALLLPFVGDVHVDHQLIFQAAMVAARPHQSTYPTTILAYETLSETNWNAPYLTPGFHPNVFVDISDTLDAKLKAMGVYGSQLRASPHERSIEALKALATLRGATMHLAAAEAFVLVRSVIHL